MQEVRNELSSPSPSDLESGGGLHKNSKFFTTNSSDGEKTDPLSINLIQISGEDHPKEISYKDQMKKSLEKSNQSRLKANLLFKKNKFKDALGEYLKAIDELKILMEINKKYEILNMTNINWVRMECLNNISVCYLLLKEYSKVLDYTKEALNISSKNFIALSYRSKALIALCNYKEALENIKLALSIKTSKTLITLLKEVEDKINQEKIEKRKRDTLSAKINFNSLTTDTNSNMEECYSKISGAENEEKNNLDITSSKFKNKEDSAKSKKEKKDEENKKQSEDEKNNYFGGGFFGLLKTILKFTKIISLNCFDFLRKYKIAFLVMMILYVIIFRSRLKNKLFNTLKIKFN
jgi:tetratricopeptide (TPR) repeat protein